VRNTDERLWVRKSGVALIAGEGPRRDIVDADGFLIVVSGFLKDRTRLHGRIGSRAGNAVGQDAADLVQQDAAVHAIGKKIAVDTPAARAFHQVADIKVKAMSVVVGHGCQ
jgi:hypothetical protein